MRPVASWGALSAVSQYRRTYSSPPPLWLSTCSTPRDATQILPVEFQRIFGGFIIKYPCQVALSNRTDVHRSFEQEVSPEAEASSRRKGDAAADLFAEKPDKQTISKTE